MAMPDSQLYHCLIKYKLDIIVYYFEIWLLLIVGSLQKLIAHFLLRKTLRNYNVLTLLEKRRLQEGTVVNQALPPAWRVTWNYAYSPFKYEVKAVYAKVICRLCTKLQIS